MDIVTEEGLEMALKITTILKFEAAKAAEDFLLDDTENGKLQYKDLMLEYNRYNDVCELMRFRLKYAY